MKKVSYKKLYLKEKALRERYEKLFPEGKERIAMEQAKVAMLRDAMEKAIMYGDPTLPSIRFGGLTARMGLMS